MASDQRVLLFIGLIFLLFCCFSVNGKVYINEVMIAPRQGSDYEYIELYNADEIPQDLSGWKITGGVVYTFPNNAQIKGKGYAVLCNNKKAFIQRYPNLTDVVFGDFVGNYSIGESVNFTMAGVVTTTLSFPVNMLVAKFGASWENRCPESDLWIPSPLSVIPETNEEFSGTPGAANSWLSCAPQLPVPPQVFISELMFNPVTEVTLDEIHEFVELYNPNKDSVDISNWRLIGAESLRYTFPPKTVIPATTLLVIAKNITALKDVYTVPDSAVLIGGYDGELDNKGEAFAIVDDNNQVVDFVYFNDKFPWPYSPDSFGASQKFAPKFNQSEYYFRGFSLNRISFSYETNNISNWIDQLANPGNFPEVSTVLPVVINISIDPLPAAINNESDVTVNITLSCKYDGTPSIVYQLFDPFTRTYVGSEVSLPMNRLSNTIFQVVLPKQNTGRVVNYKFVGEGFINSPRPNDPFSWHRYHVNQIVNTVAKYYQLYITPQSWSQLWYNIKAGRNFATELGPECGVNPQWNDPENATIVYKGQVCECTVRFQGNWARAGGELDNITVWPFPGPSYTNPASPDYNASEPFRALNFRIDLPRYCTFDGDQNILFHKIDRSIGSCTHLASSMIYPLMAEANQVSLDVDFARLHVNGGYFRYMLQLEMPDSSDVVDRYLARQQLICPTNKHEQEAWIYKNVGCLCEDGPISIGDYRIIPPGCGYSTFERFSSTFELETLNRKTNRSEAIMELAIGINETMETQNVQLARQFLEKNFDVNYMLTHFAMMAWASAFDDIRHNHFLIRRRSDNKYIMLAWDADFLFVKNPNRDVFYGGKEDPDDPDDYSRLKQIFFYAFSDEYLARLEWLNDNILTETKLKNLAQYIAEEKWQYSEQQQQYTPIDPSNDMNSCYDRSLDFINTRSNVIKSVKSTYDRDTYTVDLCMDSPTVKPVYSIYKSAPGKSIAPQVFKDVYNPAVYTLSWYPSNPNGCPIESYEVYVRTDSSGPISDSSEPIYNGTGRSCTWRVPGVQYPTTFQFYVRAKNKQGYGSFSEPFNMQYYTADAINALTNTGAVWYYVGAIIAVVVIVIVIVVLVFVNKAKNGENYAKFSGDDQNK